MKPFQQKSTLKPLFLNLCFLIISILLFTINAIGQKKLTLDEYYKNLRKLNPASIEQLQWIPDVEEYSLIENNVLYKIKLPDTNKVAVITLSQVNKELESYKISTLKRFPSYQWQNNNEILITTSNYYFTLDLTQKQIKLLAKLPDDAENETFNKQRKIVAYTQKNNLFLAQEENYTAVTNDDNKGIVNGQSVHRNEFGIHNGIFWSPNGNLLAFYRMDETMVTEYPLVETKNVSNRIAEVKPIRYPMAGMKSHEVTVGVYNPNNKSTIFLETGEPKEQYLTNVTWSLDEKYIYIAVLNRDQNHMKLNKYDASNGKYITTLFEEINEKYVEPENGPIFIPNANGNFLWFSKRDGFKHLYLYDINGKLIRQLTKGNYDVTDFLGFNSLGTAFYYTSTEISPLERTVFAFDLKKFTKKRISQTKGTNTALISTSGKFLINRCSSIEVASRYDLINSEGKIIKTLLEDKNPLKDYSISQMEIFTIKAADDSTTLYCRLIKPADFDASKKYPVIVYVYGGPHNQLVADTWLGDAGIFLHYLAQQGYLVFTVDSRGSSDRGLAFEQAIFRNLGKVELLDQLKGVEYLKKLNYVDTTHMGIHGWSYGGFLTLSMMLKYPDVFKVAVAGGPVIDWKLYEVMYGERYMDTPETNPDGYEKSNLLNFTKNLKGKTLIIHGAMDNTVVMQHSLLFLQKCIEEGTQVDFFVYPHHEHNVGGIDRLHLMRKIEMYFNDYLKNSPK